MIEEYLHLMSDLPHVLVEITFIILVDFLFLGLLWPLAKKRIMREHNQIDAEHGVKNHGVAQPHTFVVTYPMGSSHPRYTCSCGVIATTQEDADRHRNYAY